MEDEKKWELCSYDILKAEHDVMHEALTTWVGLKDNDSAEDIQYLWGVHDLAHNLLMGIGE